MLLICFVFVNVALIHSFLAPDNWRIREWARFAVRALVGIQQAVASGLRSWAMKKANRTQRIATSVHEKCGLVFEMTTAMLTSRDARRTAVGIQNAP
jgi:hypothetical protein